MSDYELLMGLIQSRRSIRRFAARAVKREDLKHLFEAASWAPSSHNRQPWRFLVIEDRQQIAGLADAVGRELANKLKSLPEMAAAYAGEFKRHATFFAEAPVLIVVLHKQPVRVAAPLLAGLKNPELVSGEPLSAAMAVQNLLLAAHALGLGACALTGPLLVQGSLTGALTLPAGHELTCLVAVGHPAECPSPPRRRSLEQIVEFRNNPARVERP